jgi:glycosyltransferase involved in cell wall biosynthesis
VGREAKALATGLQKLISNRQLFDSMSENAEEFASGKFNPARMLEEHSQIYQA